MSVDIIRGATFKQEIQIMNDLLLPSGALNRIISTTSDNPAKCNTQYPHGLSTGNKIYISDINDNWIVCGNQVVTVISATQFTVPVAGQVASQQNGTISTTIDATSLTVTLSLIRWKGDAAIDGITANLVWIDRTTFDFYVNIDDEGTALIDSSSKEILLKIVYSDSSDNETIEYIPLSVNN